MKEGFLLYHKALENLKTLGNDVAMEVISAMSKYDQGMPTGELSPVAQFAFNAYAPYLDTAKRRYEANRNNGFNGGRPRDNPAEPSGNPTEPRDNPAEPRDNHTVTVTVTDTVNATAKEKEKEKGNPAASFRDFLHPGLSDATGPPEKNYAMVFEAVKSRWLEVTGQETRETLFTVSPPKRERFVNTLVLYSLEDIDNAIANYWYAKNHPDEYDIKGRVYGTLAGFLENGVGQFYHDDTVKSNFGRQANGD